MLFLCPAGFGWDSCEKGGYWGIVKEKIPEIREAGFTHVWLPPPSQSVAPQVLVSLTPPSSQLEPDALSVDVPGSHHANLTQPFALPEFTSDFKVNHLVTCPES